MKSVQQEMVFRTWGGRRRGAGRKPTGERAGVPHRSRPVLSSRHPVHVTLKMDQHVWSLRSRRSFRVIERAFRAGRTWLLRQAQPPARPQPPA